MKNFKPRDDKRGGFRRDRDDKGSRSEDKQPFYGKSRGGDRSTDREVRTFKAVCSDCRKSCEVPFKPSSDKPVFCRDCFSAKRDRETKEYKASLANGTPKMFGQSKSVPQGEPTRTTFVAPGVDESTKEQIAVLSSKLEKLTILVEKMIEEKSVSVKKVTPKVVVAKKASPKLVVAKKVAVKKVVVAKKAVAVKKVVAKVASKKVATKKSK